MTRIGVLLLLLALGAAHAQDAVDKEYLVKAAYLYNFATYTKWPRKIETFRIGVLSASPMSDPFRAAVGTLVDKKKLIQERPIEVVEFTSPEDLADCEILFVKSGEHLPAALESMKGKSVLVITESPGLGEQGAMFNFVLDGGKVKFEINRQSLEREKMKVDFRVLSLGKIVGEPKSPPAVTSP